MVRRKSQFLPAFIKEGLYKDMDARRQKIFGGHHEMSAMVSLRKIPTTSN